MSFFSFDGLDKQAIPMSVVMYFPHQRFVSESQNRKLIIAERSAHNVPEESPEVIVNAIKKMLN